MAEMSTEDTGKNVAVLPDLPRLVPTEPNVLESVPGLLGLLIVAPFIALPLLVQLYLNLTSDCRVSCSETVDQVGVRLLNAMVGAARVPDAFRQSPIMADVGLSVLAVAAAIIVCFILRIPPIGGTAPLLNVTTYLRQRTGQGFDFAINEVGHPHRITVHVKGRFTGYPGDLLIALRLTLPDMHPLDAERSIAPVADTASARAVVDYVYDPICFQFTPIAPSRAHLWISYGNGPDANVSVRVTCRE